MVRIGQKQNTVRKTRGRGSQNPASTLLGCENSAPAPGISYTHIPYVIIEHRSGLDRPHSVYCVPRTTTR